MHNSAFSHEMFKKMTLNREQTRMKKPKCWNCGEDCVGKVEEQESQTVVPIHYFAEKKEVCPDCYQILRELDNLN
jgi:uncharacterized protein with PIN domain